MSISDEDIIAYLLGDSTPQQRELLESQLGVDSSLRDRVTCMRLVLGQLDSLQVSYEPPGDLFSRTMDRIDEVNSDVAANSGAASSSDAASLTAPSADLDSATGAKAAPSPKVALASNLSGNVEHPNRRPYWDSTALVLCMSLLVCLLLPTVLRARYESRRTQCAHNVQGLGRSLVSLALIDPHNRFPAVTRSGPESFAGVYAVHLRDVGLLESSSQVQCASLEGSKPFRGEVKLDIPTLSQLRSYDLPELEICRESVGGDYAYGLGVVENGEPVAPRCEGRSQYAILADAPLFLDGVEYFPAHDGVGINVFFEDGHVAFLRLEGRDVGCDDPFLNLVKEHEAGLSKQDACLGPSHFGPLGND